MKTNGTRGKRKVFRPKREKKKGLGVKTRMFWVLGDNVKRLALMEVKDGGGIRRI